MTKTSPEFVAYVGDGLVLLERDLGILVQMFAIVVYSDSYSYFQHCIRGLQKDEDHCACIGVCEDIDECMKYFPDFEIDDLF